MLGENGSKGFGGQDGCLINQVIKFKFILLINNESEYTCIYI